MQSSDIPAVPSKVQDLRSIPLGEIPETLTLVKVVGRITPDPKTITIVAAFQSAI